MTELSKTILQKYQVRKSKTQKDRFISLLRTHFPEINIEDEKHNTKNLVLGDVSKANIIIGAHYDTCAWLPVPNLVMPMNPILSIAYSFILIIPMFIITLGLRYLLTLITTSFWVQHWVPFCLIYVILLLLVFGPANPNTANDNTSGVITLCELYQKLTDTQKENVALVFFDNEEKGLIGSSLFRKRYKNQISKKLLINLDCVSDGDNILIAVSKEARPIWNEVLEKAFLSNTNKKILFRKLEKVYYPSDQAGFNQSVAVTALKHKRGVGYYLDKIHTKKDTIMDERNITLLCDSLQSLMKQ